MLMVDLHSRPPEWIMSYCSSSTPIYFNDSTKNSSDMAKYGYIKDGSRFWIALGMLHFSPREWQMIYTVSGVSSCVVVGAAARERGIMAMFQLCLLLQVIQSWSISGNL